MTRLEIHQIEYGAVSKRERSRVRENGRKG